MIEKLLTQFNKEYDFLYKHGDRVAGYDEAVAWFDDNIKHNVNFKKFVTRFNQLRQDVITSDREAAALAFTCEELGLF